MTSTRRAQVGLAGTLVVLIVLALVGLSSDREPPASPLAPYDDSATAFAAAPDESPVDIEVARVCGPEGQAVTIHEIEPVGGSGTIAVVGFDPSRVTGDCSTDEPVTLTASLRRTSGESASVDGFVVSYSVGDTDQEDLVTRAVTLCRGRAAC